MSGVSISYTVQTGGPTVYNLSFSDFTDQALPRSYGDSANLGRSANGATILTGPAFRQKYIWAISCIVPTADAESLDLLFRGWDTDRAAGLAAAVGVLDETFGSPVSSNTTFSTPPSFDRLSPSHYLVSFGLTEI